MISPDERIGYAAEACAHDDAGGRFEEQVGRAVWPTAKQTAAVAELRKPEIEHLRIPIAANHHVLRFQVAMDDTSGMRR